jgi:hypothetical protein
MGVLTIELVGIAAAASVSAAVCVYLGAYVCTQAPAISLLGDAHIEPARGRGGARGDKVCALFCRLKSDFLIKASENGERNNRKKSRLEMKCQRHVARKRFPKLSVPSMNSTKTMLGKKRETLEKTSTLIYLLLMLMPDRSTCTEIKKRNILLLLLRNFPRELLGKESASSLSFKIHRARPLLGLALVRRSLVDLKRSCYV